MGVVLALLYCKEGKLAAQDLLPVVLTLFPCYFFYKILVGLLQIKLSVFLKDFPTEGTFFIALASKELIIFPIMLVGRLWPPCNLPAFGMVNQQRKLVQF